MWNIMKGNKAPAADGLISTHEMRFQFSRVLRAVRAGRSLTLTYRNKPLARIVPVETKAPPTADDPIFRLHELAESIGPLTNSEIDRAVYGE
jgi:prevent-host-death family protein